MNRTGAMILVVILIALMFISCVSSSATPDVTQTVEIPSPEPTVTPTVTPTNTPSATPTPDPAKLAEAGISANSDWIPYTQTFNGVEMALVPAGCFLMGSDEGYGDEAPIHEVCFEEPFWIDVFEVSNAQVGEASPDCTDWSIDDNQPRVCINWADSVAHCESRNARLPTEAEWEYAARGPDALIYPWGNEFDLNNGVYVQKTSPVGSKEADRSWVGAYDMSGNVSEWISDWYGETYYSTLGSSTINPQGPDEGTARVVKGGDWGITFFFNDPSIPASAFARTRRDPLFDGSLTGGIRCAASYQP